MSGNDRIIILFSWPFMHWPVEGSFLESLYELRRLAYDLREDGIILFPYPPVPLSQHFYVDLDDLERILVSGSFDSWSELDYYWSCWSEYSLSPERYWRRYLDNFPEILRNFQRLCESHLVSAVVLLINSEFREGRPEYVLHQISEFFPMRNILLLDMGRAEWKDRALFQDIRYLRYPLKRLEIRAALRSFVPGLGKEKQVIYECQVNSPLLHTARNASPKPTGILDLAVRVKNAMSWRQWKKSIKLGPEAVHMGASAPTRVRPGDQFTARFSAYHPAFAKDAKKALKQPGAIINLDQFHTSWKKGEEVRVVLEGDHLTAVPSEQKFIWEGTHITVQFDVKVDSNITERCDILLKFDVYIQESVVARIRLSLTIENKLGFLNQLFVPGEQFLSTVAPQTAYASYAVADKSEVMLRIDALAQHAGIHFFTECLSLKPIDERKPVLKEMIGKQELFMLFWSWAAAKSDAVRWELTTALSQLGKDYIETQRLKPLDPEPVLPVELLKVGTTLKGQTSRMQNTNKKYFIVGCTISVFVAVLVIWAFALGTMTPDQRTLISVFLSIFSGFAAASFVGAFTVKAQGLIPGVVATATGGFGVWLLTTFVILPSAPIFSVIIQPHRSANILDTFKDGTVLLQVGDELRRQSIDSNGQARFSSISSKFEGQLTPVKVEIPGFQMKNPEQEAKLQQGQAIGIPMVSDNP